MNCMIPVPHASLRRARLLIGGHVEFDQVFSTKNELSSIFLYWSPQNIQYTKYMTYEYKHYIFTVNLKADNILYRGLL